LLVPLPLTLLIRDDGHPDVLKDPAGLLRGCDAPSRNYGFTTFIGFLGAGQLRGLYIFTESELLG